MTPSERVQAERRVRDLSAREAAAAAAAGLKEKFTNTTWSRFEKEGVVTPKVRRGVAAAFGWPDDWPENLPELPDNYVISSPKADELQAQLLVLVQQMTSLAATVREQGAELERLRARLDRRGM